MSRSIRDDGDWVSTTVEHHNVFGFPLLLKRDDIVTTPLWPSGNKRRKLHHWLHNPTAALTNAKSVISCGGSQSNAMLAIAQLCSVFGRTRFEYVVRTLPSVLRAKPAGNLAAALALGMVLRELDADDYNRQRDHINAVANRRPQHGEEASAQVLHIAQGVLQRESLDGFAVLANELHADAANAGLASRDNLICLVPCGTGAAALALHRCGVRVLAVPCVGDATYLAEQMTTQLAHPLPPCRNPHNRNHLLVDSLLPPILSAGAGDTVRVPFAKPHAAMLECWQALHTQCGGGVDFDLIYTPRAFLGLQAAREHWRQERKDDSQNLKEEESIVNRMLRELESGESRLLFVHNGGVEGNATQLERYERAGLN